ncbi:hypothetical protein MHBO_002123 [Bonamia ostreae]|uniref:Protein kinase domain-containing protein n=1 Tax=Bonamia ostreae TaxID=126728 RepID=A0ABV2ALB2_9EUKA
MGAINSKLSWGKVLKISKEDLEETKCCFGANGHDGCTENFTITKVIKKTKLMSVYKVVSQKNKHLAVKIVKKGKRDEYTENEIAILAKLNGLHKNIVKCKHVFETNKYYVIFEEFLIFDIRKYLKKEKRMTLDAGRVFIRKVTKIIRFLHQNNIVYGDLKTENIMVDEKGNIRLVDFDLSIRLDHNYTEDFQPLGTVYYTAPEQVVGKTCKQSDWWGLGCLLCEIYMSLTANEMLFLNRSEYVNQDAAIIALQQLDEDLKLEDEDPLMQPALPFINECVKLKVEDRIDLDKAQNLGEVEFLKDVTAAHKNEFVDEMKRFANNVIRKEQKAFLMLY